MDDVELSKMMSKSYFEGVKAGAFNHLEIVGRFPFIRVFSIEAIVPDVILFFLKHIELCILVELEKGYGKPSLALRKKSVFLVRTILEVLYNIYVEKK